MSISGKSSIFHRVSRENIWNLFFISPRSIQHSSSNWTEDREISGWPNRPIRCWVGFTDNYHKLNGYAIESAMLESRIASTDSHLSQVSCRLPKRPSPSGTTTLLKRLKNDECLLHEPFDSSNSNPTDTESKSSSSDMDDIPEQCDDTSDMEECDEDATTATDQSEYRPCVYSSTISRPVPTRYSKALLQQFHELRDQSSRKGIELTRCPDQIIEAKKSSWELSNSFQRTDLIKEGHAVLSDQAFPFYSLCYMVSSQRERHTGLLIPFDF